MSKHGYIYGSDNNEHVSIYQNRLASSKKVIVRSSELADFYAQNQGYFSLSANNPPPGFVIYIHYKPFGFDNEDLIGKINVGTTKDWDLFPDPDVEDEDIYFFKIRKRIINACKDIIPLIDPKLVLYIFDDGSNIPSDKEVLNTQLKEFPPIVYFSKPYVDKIGRKEIFSIHDLIQKDLIKRFKKDVNIDKICAEVITKDNYPIIEEISEGIYIELGPHPYVSSEITKKIGKHLGFPIE